MEGMQRKGDDLQETTKCELDAAEDGRELVCRVQVLTVAAVGIADQTGVTVLPWVPSGVGAQNVGVLQAPRAEGSVLGLPQGGSLPWAGRCPS